MYVPELSAVRQNAHIFESHIPKRYLFQLYEAVILIANH